MYNVTLVSSFHRNVGKCNPDELYKIVEEIKPEVIFEELCFETFSYVYASSYIPITLEAIAIKYYLKNYPVKHFPIDTYPIDESDIFNGANEIAKKSIKYAKLWSEHLFMIKQYGFDFLNSNACTELLDKIHIVEESVLIELNNVELSHEYRSEIELTNKREYEMLRNIYNWQTISIQQSDINLRGRT